MNSDYASFGYLEDEPAAFARVPLAPESGRVPAYDGGFDDLGLSIRNSSISLG